LQMIGRCLRPQPGKRAVVLDHVGNTLRLGHHLELRDWSLDGIKKRDREAAPSVKVCPQCFATSAGAAQVCRECGHVFAPQERRELQQVDGELVEHVALPPIGPYKVGDIVKGNYEVTQVLEDGWITCANEVGEFRVHQSEARFVSRPSLAVARKREQGSAQSLDDLRQLAQQRGYKRGWAERVYQARLAKRHGL
jgi:superfamily II DNA or RNA helicase